MGYHFKIEKESRTSRGTKSHLAERERGRQPVGQETAVERHCRRSKKRQCEEPAAEGTQGASSKHQPRKAGRAWSGRKIPCLQTEEQLRSTSAELKSAAKHHCPNATDRKRWEGERQYCGQLGSYQNASRIIT